MDAVTVVEPTPAEGAGGTGGAAERRRRRIPEWAGALIGTLLIGFVLSRFTSAFLNPRNLINVLAQIAVVGFMAAGQTFVILTRGIDLSVAAIGALAGTLAGWVSVTLGYSGTTGVLVALAAASFVGLVHGLLVAYGGLPAFIVTLGGLSVWRGVALELTGGINNTGLPNPIRWFAAAQVGPIPVSVLLMLVTFSACAFLLSQTRFGIGLYAIGGDEEASRRAGVPVKRYITQAYVLCGLLSGFGGILLAGRLDSAGGSIAAGYELRVIAAVVIGGLSLFGGVGSVWAALFGAILMGVIQNGMNLIGVSSFLQMIVLGSVIVLAIGIDVLRKRLSERLS